MRFGSVCSGIEAASVAWHPLGWEAAWFSEIEPFPSAVLAHHYPSVPNLGDMTRLPALIRSGAVEVPDILCGGTPCQAFSVAGLRRSLDDDRGNLSLTFCEIADAIDEHRPAIIFWENVPGVLNTKDNAFGCFLAGLAGEDEALIPPGGRWTNAGFVDGPARAVAWRVLDAQYFGLAQRRRRVFVVASARADFDPAAVLFELQGVRRDSAPSREAGKVAPTVPSRSSAGGGLGTDFDCDGGLIPDIVGTLEASLGRSRGAGTPTAALQPYEVANCLTQRMHKGINTTLDKGQTPVLVHSLRGEGFDASEDGTGRGTPLVPVLAIDGEFNSASHVIGPITTGAAHSNRGPMVAHAFAQNQRDEVRLMDVAGRGTPLVPVGFNARQDPDCWQDRTGPLDTDGSTQAVGTDCYNGAITGDVAATLGTPGSSVNASGPTVMQVMQVRRLTPVECERLQGFPDNYTNIPWRGKPESPDGPRYKALSNSWAVPVVRWIGRRIANALA